jgi:hypothetical protein
MEEAFIELGFYFEVEFIARPWFHGNNLCRKSNHVYNWPNFWREIWSLTNHICFQGLEEVIVIPIYFMVVLNVVKDWSWF